ncbi:MAG: diacylglyceryl transferase [Bacteroidetes bacterium]|nr:MAG: diacylglyceryl transferase [Bacteroidota bacterium]
MDLQGFKLINAFGLLVAFAFIAAAWALSTELKRRQRNGWLGYTETKIWVGKGADMGEVAWNAFFGFIIGWKFIGLFLERDTAFADPQAFLLSAEGSVPIGIVLALFFAGLKWYMGNKTKLAKPEQRSIRIWPHDRVGDMTIFAAIFGFGGAKLFHNLENWDDLVQDPLGALLSFSGLTFYGGLICAGLAIAWYARKHKINLWQLCDSFGPAMMLAYAVGRMGCQVSGDGDWGINNSAYVSSPTGKSVLAQGTAYADSVNAHLGYFKQSLSHVTEVQSAADVMQRHVVAPAWMPDWMVAYTYPHNVLSEGVPNVPGGGQWDYHLPLPVFPTPFYETIMCLLLFGLLWSLRKKMRSPGLLFGLYLFLNGLERFFIEKIRVNTTFDLAGFRLTQAEVIAMVLMAGGIAIMLLRRGKQPVAVKAEVDAPVGHYGKPPASQR